MPVSDSPQKTEENEKKPNNLPWIVVTLVLLIPSLFIAFNIVSQPPGNRLFLNMNRPDVGTGFDIRSAQVLEDELTVTVTYNGGCEDHVFNLYVEDQKSDVNRRLELHHISEDSCNTRVTEDLMFDLESVVAEHDSDQIIFTLIGNGAEPDPILYKKPKVEDLAS